MANRFPAFITPVIRLGFLAVCSVVAACSQAPPTTTPATAETAKAATCRVLEVSGNENRSKLNANLLLGRKIPEEELRVLSTKLHDSLGGYAKSYFAFYLPGMRVGSGAWATAQFTPTGEVRILGATQAEEDSSKSKLRITGHTIGKWYEEQRSASGLAFYEQGGTCYLMRVFRGGAPVISRFIRNGNTFKSAEGQGLGEYFVLQGDGTLAFVNAEGSTFGLAHPLL